MVMRTAMEADLSSGVMIHMLFNIALDFVVGLVPFLGDLADMAYKANTRNALVLEDYLRQRGRENLRKSGLPQETDFSLEEVDYEEGTVTTGQQPIREPKPVYGGSSRGYTGSKREYDPESQRGDRSGDHKSGGHKSGGHKSKKGKEHGHSRLQSQETGTTAH